MTLNFNCYVPLGLENKKADDGFLTKLIVTAIKNIQISINNVHVCFEDSTTNKRNPFQLGVSFSQLLFETEDNPEKKSPNEQIIHKLIKLEGFSLYLNVKKVCVSEFFFLILWNLYLIDYHLIDKTIKWFKI